MKYTIGMLVAIFSVSALIAQERVNEAVIQTKMEINNPDNGQIPGGLPEGAMVMRFGDGDITSKIFFKNGMTKIETDMGMGKNQVIIDGVNKKTTTLIEAMGRKMGFTSTDAEMQAMMQGGDSSRQRPMPNFNPEVFVEYLNDAKKIAGVVCKKAMLRYLNRKGEEVNQAVWYAPDVQMGEGFRMNDMMRAANIPGLEKIKGFPMEFEMTRPNGATVHYTVTKLDLNAKVEDKTFIIPKDYDIKPMSEMRQGGPGMRFRMGGSM